MSKPHSCVFAYGARIADSETAYQILRLANKYKNKRIEIELERREAWNKHMAEYYPDWDVLRQERDRLEELDKDKEADVAAELKAARTAEKTRRKAIYKARNEQLEELARTRFPEWDIAQKALAAIKAEIKREGRSKERIIEQKRCQILEKEWRRKVYAIDPFLAGQMAIDDAANDKVKAARPMEASGIYWGTTQQVDESCRTIRAGAPPRHHRYDGRGRIAVQIPGGLLVTRLTASSMIQLDLVAADQEHRQKPIRTGRIRIGSNGQAPIWLEFSCRWHRPLPGSALIKKAWLHASRVGPVTKWSLQFIIDTPHVAAYASRPNTAGNAIALDLGWRIVPEGLRVAWWHDTRNGDGSYIIPSEQIRRWLYPRELQAIRDQRFNEIKPAIIAWRDASARDGWTERFTERISKLGQWKKSAQLASLITYWRDNRVPGDEDLFKLLDGHREAWRNKNHHLYIRQAYQSRGVTNWRRNFYRGIAADLAREYGHIVVEKIDWRKLAETTNRIAKKHMKEWEYDALVRYRALGASGEFKSILKQTGLMDEVEPEKTTMNCHQCQGTCHWQHIRLVHICEHCGTQWDQDYNAARNILYRWTGDGECPEPEIVNPR